MSQQLGFVAERQAKDYLLAQGLKFITSNYRCRLGEIDLVMSEKDYIIFVEVRSRVSAEYGGALASITPAKIRKIIKTATHFLVTKNLYSSHCARFDVISIQGPESKIEWIKSAFDTDGR